MYLKYLRPSTLIAIDFKSIQAPQSISSNYRSATTWKFFP